MGMTLFVAINSVAYQDASGEDKVDASVMGTAFNLSLLKDAVKKQLEADGFDVTIEEENYLRAVNFDTIEETNVEFVSQTTMDMPS